MIEIAVTQGRHHMVNRWDGRAANGAGRHFGQFMITVALNILKLWSRLGMIAIGTCGKLQDEIKIIKKEQVLHDHVVG